MYNGNTSRRSNHLFVGKFHDFDMFWYYTFCLTHSEWTEKEANDLSKRLQNEGLYAPVGHYNHYSHVFGISRRQDHQPCVVISSLNGKQEEVMSLLHGVLEAYSNRVR